MLEVGQTGLFGTSDVLGVCRNGLTVRVVDKVTADATIKKHHYSRTVAWASSEHYGAYSPDGLVAVLQFGPAMNPASGGGIVEGVPDDAWLELSRMWISDHTSVLASRILSQGLQLLRHRRPALWFVQSYADERCGKLGGVYQAASFVYCGHHRTVFYELDGEWYHQSMMGRPEFDKRGWWHGPRIAHLNANHDRAEKHTFNQYRYLRLFTKRARRNLRLPELPYPKLTDG